MKKTIIAIILFFSISFSPVNAQIATTDKLITVDTSKQMLYAWENGQIINSTPVSTGLYQTPTIKGTFKIYAKLPSQRMRGISKVNGPYDLSSVPHVMYFHSEYAIHGAYWHNNFGTRMSNGCVNVPLDKAVWLYEWAGEGTQVQVY